MWKRSHFIIDLKEVGKSCGRQGANSPEGQNSKCKGPAAAGRGLGVSKRRELGDPDLEQSG